MKIFFLALFLTQFTQAQDAPKLPNSTEREHLFKQVVSEINRLDGEGLIPRYNRPEDWTTTTNKLTTEAKEAKTLNGFGRVFKRLDATYPNLHARVYLHPDLDIEKSEGFLKFNFTIKPDLKASTQDNYRYFIFKHKNDTSDLKHGDEVISINDLTIKNIEDQNFIFCKMPLKSQCALELFPNFRKEILNWTRQQPLEITILRAGKELKILIKPEILPLDKKQNDLDLNCEEQQALYKNFDLEFKGYNLCAYHSQAKPQVLVLRIKSFVYNDGDPIGDLENEIDFFWTNYWKKNSAKIKTVIFDVTDNHGGKSPISYYGIFTNKPYQEQYAQYRKIKEFERPDIFQSLFWGDAGKEIWLKNLKTSGNFEKLSEGDFLPPVPQFCANQKKDCTEDLFQPRKHHFKGNIKIIMNQWCISSCVGFVDNMIKLFKGKVKTYGHPDSGDSAYSRATVAASFEKNKSKVELLILKKARKPDNPEPWIRQIVSVTRSTDSTGHIISGRVQKIDHWIPQPWDQTDEDWIRAAFNTAIKN